jgi:hypothetical protein
MQLFYKWHGLNVDPFIDGEVEMIDTIQKLLADSGIIKNESKNIVYKMVGRPPQDSLEDCEGIDSSKLNALALYVCGKLNLQEKFGMRPESSWYDFTKNAFAIPEYLNFQMKGYYKFLSPSEKQAVTGFIMRQVNEILEENPDVLTYTAAMWSGAGMEIVKAVVQLNLRYSFASYNFYVLENGNLIPRVTMRTNIDNGSLKLNGNNAFLNFVEENPEKKFLNLCFILNIRDIKFDHLNFLKGVLTTTAMNGTVPVTQKVILKKTKNFETAISEIKESKTESEIAFDLIQSQFKVQEERVDPLTRLESYRVYELCEEVSGVYVMGFPMLVEVIGVKPQGKIGIGICEIGADGIVKIMSDTKGYIKCFVENLYINHNLICISHHVHPDDRNPIKIEYCLKIVKEEATSVLTKVEFLVGSFVTIYNKSECLHGDIVFKRAREYKTLEECSDVVKPGIVDIQGGKAELMYDPYLPKILEKLNQSKKNQVETNYELKIKYE